MTSGRLWNYYRDEVNNHANENDDANNNEINNTIKSKSFEYKRKIRRTLADNNKLDAEIVVPWKCFSDFWRFFYFPLINCEVELDLSWSKEFIISQISIVTEILGDPDVSPPVQLRAAIQRTGVTFQLK